MKKIIEFHKESALNAIKNNLQSGFVVPTNHFKDQLKVRHISMQDVLNALKHGRINDPPKLDKETNQFKYRVEGPSIDGEQVTVVLVLEDDKNILVTVWGEEEG
jgi:hypothetical protein